MKRLILLLSIVITSFGTVIAQKIEPITEKFEKIEMNVEACVKVIRTDSCFSVIIPDTVAMKCLDLNIVDKVLKVSYKTPIYKSLLIDPIRIIVMIPDTVEIRSNREYTLKYKPRKN